MRMVSPDPANVESRCDAVSIGLAYLFPALSVTGVSLALPLIRFHIPLIKLGVRFSRTQLSDKALRHILLHTFAHEQLRLGSLKPVQAQLLVQVIGMEAFLSMTLHLELHAQPLAYPMSDVAVDVPVGFAHRPNAKIVGPTL
jgi:hypothetical protein